MKNSFYSHGKLLLTAEYVVLDGAKALAVPTQKGQWLTVEETNSNYIHWRSMDKDGLCWFETEIEIIDGILNPISNITNDTITDTLINILSAAKLMNPQFLAQKKGYRIETKLQFDRQWGLGSSSTLINNIAQWAQVNAFDLLDKSFGGSGYDIACAQHKKSIFYKRNEGNPIVKEVNFDPVFKDHIYFIYLNQKQDSKASIRHYQSLPLKDYEAAEKEISKISDDILACTSLVAFETLIDTHEQIISRIIKTPTIKSKLFADYPKSIKSLGGWGGDFVLATGTLSNMDYFKDKGFTTIISYAEMVLYQL